MNDLLKLKFYQVIIQNLTCFISEASSTFFKAIANLCTRSVNYS